MPGLDPGIHEGGGVLRRGLKRAAACTRLGPLGPKPRWVSLFQNSRNFMVSASRCQKNYLAHSPEKAPQLKVEIQPASQHEWLQL